MNDIYKRAWKKTALTVLFIAVLVAIANVFSFLGGYFLWAFFILLGVLMIYGIFEMWEGTDEWNRRKK